MRLLIDTDPGIDDALALVLAFTSPEAQVMAISTVAGNVPVDQATTNTLRILAVVRPRRRVRRVARGADAAAQARPGDRRPHPRRRRARTTSTGSSSPTAGRGIPTTRCPSLRCATEPI